jgi:hypothetical protein
LALGALVAPIAIRIMMIETQMQAALNATGGPIRRPALWPYVFRNIREYRRTFPDGPLNAKLLHCLWAMAPWFMLMLSIMFFVLPAMPSFPGERGNISDNTGTSAQFLEMVLGA